MRHIVVGGLYEHYKGKRYRVHGVVRHSETLELMALYDCLYDNDFGKTWVRPLELFLSTIFIDGVERERFTLVSEK